MSFLDKITKAVSDTVDRGKKEVDQFMRVQKVKGEISEAERRIEEADTRIGDIKRGIGERVVGLLRSGALAQPELEAMAGPITELELHIEQQRAVIADKKLEIERIKAEDDTEAAGPQPSSVSGSPAATTPPPPAEEPVSPASTAAVPQPAVAASATSPRFCSSCGKPVAPGSEVCASCGARLR